MMGSCDNKVVRLHSECVFLPMLFGWVPQVSGICVMMLGDAMWPRRVTFAVLIVASLWACGETTPTQAPPVADKPRSAGDTVSVAKRLLVPETTLPVRAEVVALSDRLSIASAREGKNARGSELAFLAARLRERLWRFDRTTTDAREAIELYSAVVASSVDGVVACRADFRQARLRGELARDGAETYRSAYLARARQTATAAKGGSACVTRIEQLVANSEVLRPRGDAWAQLQVQAKSQAKAQHARIHGPVLGAPTATSSASAIPAAQLLGARGDSEVVVTPDPKVVSKGIVSLTDVETYSYPRGGRVVLTLSAPATYEVGVLPPEPQIGRGDRIYLDLFRTRLKGVKRQVDATGLVRGVRLGKRKDGTRIVLDLAGPAYRRVFYLPNPFRVVIDLSTRKPSRAAQTIAGGAREVRRVVLDPGHGGWDAGAMGPTGLEEKDVVLDVAHRAAPALASELGIETMLTRDTDVYVPLEERTARANAYHADLFISVHCNATENGEAHGVQIFMLDPSREMDAAALRAATRENLSHLKHKKRSKPKGPVLSPAELEAQVADIAAGLSVGDTTSRSRLFAELLQKSTLSSLNARYPKTQDHGVKTAGFFVLLGADMPSVLYETAFISNSGDEKRLAKADFRQKLADAIVNAVRAYRTGHGK